MKGNPANILFVFGTRPEAIKLAPVILEAKKRNYEVKICLTAQHREMVDQVIRLFDIRPDYDLNIMEEKQSLTDLTHRLIIRMRDILKRVKPSLLVIQGDTTTAFAIALQAFYAKIKIAHIEAGLRTHEKYQPYPEEMNRVLISHLADYHFAPTRQAHNNLLREGIPKDRVIVTGNTVVDALLHIRKRVQAAKFPAFEKIVRGKKVVLVTMHRRENIGKPLRAVCMALKKIVSRHPEAVVIFPVHLNPRVRRIVHGILGQANGVCLFRPLPYEEFIFFMERAYLIITDSGGIQEEAPSFGKPVLITRNVSERQEGIDLGIARIVGTSEQRIYREASQLLGDEQARLKMVKQINPYGDGKASQRILRRFDKILNRRKNRETN